MYSYASERLLSVLYQPFLFPESRSCFNFFRSNHLKSCPAVYKKAMPPSSPRCMLSRVALKFSSQLPVSRTWKSPDALWVAMDTVPSQDSVVFMLTIYQVQRASYHYFLFSPPDVYQHSYSYEGDNFVLDQQVVRAAVKSHNNMLESRDASTLSPSTTYLRLLLGNATGPSLPPDTSWQDPATAIHLLEWRAALLVREYAQNIDELDAFAGQRVAKAVTEAFVAARVGDTIKSLPNEIAGRQDDIRHLEKLYLLVRSFLLFRIDLLSDVPYSVPFDNSRNRYCGSPFVRCPRYEQWSGCYSHLETRYQRYQYWVVTRGYWPDRRIRLHGLGIG